MRRTSVVGLAAVWFLAASPVRGAADDPRALAQVALEENPVITSIERQIVSLRHQADAAARWRDPVLALEYSNVAWDSWRLDDSPMSGVQIKLQQTLTLPGKNDRRVKTARGETEVKRWELREKELQLAALVKQTYWRLALVRHLERINRRHLALVAQLSAAVRAKYQVGESGQHDLLALEVLEQKLDDDLGDFNQQERALLATLNAALHREASATVATPGELPVAATPRSLSTLLQLAEEHRPRLSQARATSSWRRLLAEQAGYERWPDITVWAGYRVRASSGADPGTDFVNVGVSVPLPLDYTGRAGAEQEQHLALAAAADEAYRAALDEIRAGLAGSLAAWRRATQKTETYEARIIPGADQALQATLAAFQTGRADFASLYQAEVQLLELKRTATIARATTQIEQSEVEALVGVDLDGLTKGEVNR